ncbi:CPS-53 (KpLE1) prophage protein [Escherichia coli]|nr:CPS-53 (KpLE1) prophage protein [Escherichia coli]
MAFEFKCVPFEGLKERPFKLRLSIITGDRPVLVLRIIQLEAVQEDMANEFRDLLVEKFKRQQSRNLYWYFHRLISLLQMPLRGHLWKRN